MFYLRTGGLGAGKTLNTLKEVHMLSVKEDRRVYYFNIELSDEGKELFGERWTRIDEQEIQNWKSYPPGTIFLIDECHKVFPLRSATSKPPVWIEDLAEHRSQGVDFYLITQHYKDIDVFVRRRIYHFVNMRRPNGFDGAVWTTYESPNFDEELWRQAPSTERKPFPKEYYEYYNSSSLHTVKKRIPKQFYMLAGLVGLLVVIVYFAWNHLFGADEVPKVHEVLEKVDKSIEQSETKQYKLPAYNFETHGALSALPNSVIDDKGRDKSMVDLPPYLLHVKKIYLLSQMEVFGVFHSTYALLHDDGEQTEVDNDFFVKTGGLIVQVDQRCTHRIVYPEIQFFTRCQPIPVDDEGSSEAVNSDDDDKKSNPIMNPFQSIT